MDTQDDIQDHAELHLLVEGWIFSNDESDLLLEPMVDPPDELVTKTRQACRRAARRDVHRNQPLDVVPKRPHPEPTPSFVPISEPTPPPRTWPTISPARAFVGIVLILSVGALASIPFLLMDDSAQQVHGEDRLMAVHSNDVAKSSLLVSMELPRDDVPKKTNGRMPNSERGLVANRRAAQISGRDWERNISGALASVKGGESQRQTVVIGLGKTMTLKSGLSVTVRDVSDVSASFLEDPGGNPAVSGTLVTLELALGKASFRAPLMDLPEYYGTLNEVNWEGYLIRLERVEDPHHKPQVYLSLDALAFRDVGVAGATVRRITLRRLRRGVLE